jgi:hypothetical protein
MLIVRYEQLQHFNDDQFKAEDKKQADTLGWLMMTIGVYEITEKTIDEILFRTKFLDMVHGSAGFIGNPSITDLRQLFKNHLGLKIEVTNTGLKNISTRHKFMVNQLDILEERVEQKINN